MYTTNPLQSRPIYFKNTTTLSNKNLENKKEKILRNILEMPKRDLKIQKNKLDTRRGNRWKKMVTTNIKIITTTQMPILFTTLSNKVVNMQKKSRFLDYLLSENSKLMISKGLSKSIGKTLQETTSNEQQKKQQIKMITNQNVRKFSSHQTIKILKNKTTEKYSKITTTDKDCKKKKSFINKKNLANQQSTTKINFENKSHVKEQISAVQNTFDINLNDSAKHLYLNKNHKMPLTFKYIKESLAWDSKTKRSTVAYDSKKHNKNSTIIPKPHQYIKAEFD